MFVLCHHHMNIKKWIPIFGIIIVLIGVYVWSTYNRLVSLSESVDSQWAQVETQYQRRFDLIPNLVESVKGVMSQEQNIFGQIAEARSRYSSTNNINEKAEAASQAESALARLLVIMENYPELKSADNVQALMAQIEGTENRISVERKRYNDTVKVLNVTIKRFPTNIFARKLGYSIRDYFEVTSGSDVVPKVDLKG